MVTHIVAWNFKEEVPVESRADKMAAMEDNLVALQDKVPGIIDCKFAGTLLPSSNRDMTLIVHLKDAESLAIYKDHPDHVKVADTYVRPFVKDRVALDYEE